MRYHAWRTRLESEWNPKFVDLLNRQRYGPFTGPNDPYVYENKNCTWQCKVAAEVLRRKRSGVKNKLDAVPKCSDPSGNKTIQISSRAVSSYMLGGGLLFVYHFVRRACAIFFFWLLSYCTVPSLQSEATINWRQQCSSLSLNAKP